MAKDYAKRKTHLSSSRSHQRSKNKKWKTTLFWLIIFIFIIAAIFMGLIYGTHNKKYMKYLPHFLSQKIETHAKTQPVTSSKITKIPKKTAQNDIESPVRFDFYTELSHDQVVLSKNAPIKQVDEPLTTRQLQLSKLSMLLDDEYHKKANNK